MRTERSAPRRRSFLGASTLTNDRSGIIMRPEIFRVHDLSRGRESAGALLRATFNALDSVINPFGCIYVVTRKMLDRAHAKIMLHER